MSAFTAPCSQLTPAFVSPRRTVTHGNKLQCAHVITASRANLISPKLVAVRGNSAPLKATSHTFFLCGKSILRQTTERCAVSQSARQVMCVSSALLKEKIKVLVVGGGGREHALAWKMSLSPFCENIFCAPGNPGIAEDDITCLKGDALNIDDGPAVVSFCKENNIGLVVVGPEGPLVAGLSDCIRAAGMKVFGPSAAAAQLEGSKAFMKDICAKYKIDTAAYAVFSDAAAAKAHVKQQGAPIVVKADGLAAGKGVVVAMTEKDAFDAIDSMLVGNAFGAAGSRVVIEEFMEGEEASFFAITDGVRVFPLAGAQDHKAVGEGDVGPMTGGMGAYSPAPILTPAMEQMVLKDIVQPTVDGMRAEGVPFQGVLFAGLMIQNGIPRLLEYNVRFGDPECQTLMMRLESDLLEALYAAAAGLLGDLQPLTWSEQVALLVVHANKGYPGSYGKGSVIRNLAAANATAGTKVFHAGTAYGVGGEVVATGGRVLGVTSLAANVQVAQTTAYVALDKIDWPEGFCRRDIGWRAIARLEDK